MLLHGLLGKPLHAAVQGGVDFQSVCVDVIGFSLPVEILVAPAVHRVGLPGQRVLVEQLLLPGGIVASHGLLGHEHAPQIVAEIGAGPLLVVHAVEIEGERAYLLGLVLRLRKVAGPQHLPQHHIPAFPAPFVFPHGIEIAGVLAHAHQRGRLAGVQVAWFLAEIGLGGRLDAHSVVEEVEMVEIHGDDFLLGVIAFNLERNHPFDGFLQGTFPERRGRAGIELLDELLGDGASAARTLLPQDDSLHGHAHEGPEVDARMVEEALVLGGHQGLHQMRGQVVIPHKDAVGLAVAPCAQQLAVGRYDLAGVFVHRILQLLQVGHIANGPPFYFVKNVRHCHHSRYKYYP